MAGGADVEEAGVVIACPRCGQEVKEHSTIPVLADDGATQLICVECAKKTVVKQEG